MKHADDLREAQCFILREACMKNRSVFKRIVAYAVSAAMVFTGVQFPSGRAAAAEGDSEQTEETSISLPLELYDYQSDGLLFQYDLDNKFSTRGSIWHLVNPLNEYLGRLSDQSKTYLADVKGVSEQTFNTNNVTVQEGLVETNKGSNGPVYDPGSQDLLSWYLFDTVSQAATSFPMIDEEGETYTVNDTTYQWKFKDYEKYSVDDELDKYADMAESDVTAVNQDDYAHYKMYREDHYTYDDNYNDYVKLCDLYFRYYVAKVQWRYEQHVLNQAKDLAEKAADNDTASAETLLGIVKTAIDRYNRYLTDETITGADLPDEWKIDTTLRYCYGADTPEGYTNVGLNGSLDTQSQEYENDVAKIKTILNDYPQLLDVIAEAGKGRIIETKADKIIDAAANETWESYYLVGDVIPGFDYLYRHMAYSVSDTSEVYNGGFDDWYAIHSVQAKKANGHDYYGFYPLVIDQGAKATLTLDVESGVEYEITYGQAGYNGESHLGMGNEVTGTLTVRMTGATLTSGSMKCASGVTDQSTAEKIETEFTESPYNVDNIMNQAKADGLTSYRFTPNSNQIVIEMESDGDVDFSGWISGFSVKRTDNGSSVIDIPYDNTHTESDGWTTALAENMEITTGTCDLTKNTEFQTTGNTLRVAGSGTNTIYSPEFALTVGNTYEISYDIKIETRLDNGAATVLTLVAPDGTVMNSFHVQNGLPEEAATLGGMKVGEIYEEGEETWVTLTQEFTANGSQVKFAFQDSRIDGSFGIRNLSITALGNRSYVYGSKEEAAAAEAYANANAKAVSDAKAGYDTDGKGIRALVDAFVAYHESENDGTVIGTTGKYGMTAYDYVNYMLNHLFDGSSVAAKQVNTYDKLILEPLTDEVTRVTSKKTGNTYDLATYGFYATTVPNQMDGDKIVRRFQGAVEYDSTEKKIYNDFTQDRADELFPLNGEGYRAPVDNTIYDGKNYNYVMHSGGRFVYHEADNLVFMFTGDDDVYLYLNDKLALDLGGAHTAYNDYIFVNDKAEELGLKENGVYNFDFYYMERHTTESELKVVTNINVLKADAILTKGAEGAYYEETTTVNEVTGEDGTVTRTTETTWNLKGEDQSGRRENIPNGSAVPTGTKEYYLSLTGGEVPLADLYFQDEKLGVELGRGKSALPAGVSVNDLKVYITNQDGETQLYAGDVLEKLSSGIDSNETILIKGIPCDVVTGITNVATAKAKVPEAYRNSSLISGNVGEDGEVEINKAYHSMNVDEQYYVEGNAENNQNGYVLQGILDNEDFNGKTFAQLSEEEKAVLIFHAYDAEGNDISVDRTLEDGTVVKAAVTFGYDEAGNPQIKFHPENLTAKDAGDAYTTTIYYDFDATQTINGRLYSSNPVPVTVHVYVLNDDVYVLDYGLNVDLTGSKGDLFANDKYQVDPETVADRSEKFVGIGAKNAESYGAAAVTGTMGNLSTSSADVDLKTYNKADPAVNVTYSLNGKLLDGIDRFTYGVEVKDSNSTEIDAAQRHGIKLNANITIMPASIVYYEDNFAVSITDNAEADFVTNGTAVNSQNRNQKQDNDITTQYGYDGVHADDDAAYQNSNYTALSGNQSIAFTFSGTGFDILTRTSDANLYVAVYDAAKFELKNYPYTGGTMLYAAKRAGTAATEKPLKTAYINAYNENFKDGIHQIPLISMDLKDAYENGVKKFLVVATKRTGVEALHVDGIRIYNPLGTGFDRLTETEQTEAQAAYSQAEGELSAKVENVRSLILGEGYEFTTQGEDGTYSANNPSGRDDYHASLVQFADGKIDFTNGQTVVECYTGTMDSRSIGDDRVTTADKSASLLAYAMSGPNNELYLDDPQYVLAAVLNGVNGSKAEQATLQIGLKAVQGIVTVEYLAADKSWKALPAAENLSAQIEMYYKVPVGDLWSKDEESSKVLMLRAKGEGNVLSVTNLKYTGFNGFGMPTADTFTGLVDQVVTKSEETSPFEVLSSNVTGSKTTLTISVPVGVNNFNIQSVGDNSTKMNFTFYPAKGIKVLGEGSVLTEADKVTVKQRTGNEIEVYVVQFKTALSGTYQITSLNDSTYGTATFSVE